MRTVILLNLFAIIAVSSSEIELGPWFVSNSNGSISGLPVQVPGGIYSDLMKNNVIDDVFFGFNDVNTKWVSHDNWTYYANFTVASNVIDNNYVNIVFEGLDTFATILINGLKVGESKNMFVRYVFPIKDELKVGVNSIEVQFVSPVLIAAHLGRIQNEVYVVPPKCPDEAFRGECYVNQIRKMQASFSWDWGPALPSMGIWKDVYINAYNGGIIEYIVTDVVEAVDHQWILVIDVYFSKDADSISGSTEINIILDDRTIAFEAETNVKKNEHGELVDTKSVQIDKAATKLWWPNGYGAQVLYDLTVKFIDASGSSTSTMIKRIGFRKIQLIQAKVEGGLSFYFKINDHPIFMKGSNEIPIDILPERGQDKAKIKKLLSTARDSHMNMLRVWGGGVYESDYFYDLADEFGILIWQDFMFACALYPTTDGFLSNVIEEVRHQVKRLHGHPSIALFAGNNENEAALRQNWFGISDFGKYARDFVKLYVDTIRTEYLRLTHSRGIYLSSSPTNGDESVKEGYIAYNPASNLYGDVHYYNYLLDSTNSNIYPKPRFASEYGYQAFPSVESLLSATNNISDLNIDSNFMDHRQHHPGGNYQMKILISYQLNLPHDGSPNYSKMFIYYAMIQQALAMKIETEHYRSHQSELDSGSNGLTMGTLYWQLNDVWIAPTWAGIDYLGKWKMLQYYVADFFAPIIVTGSLSPSRELNIYAISDMLTLITNVTLSLDVYKWDHVELQSVSTFNKMIDLKPTSSHKVFTRKVDRFLAQETLCDEQPKLNCFIKMVLKKDGIIISPENFLLPAKLNEIKIPASNVSITSVTYIGNDSFQITLTIDKIALFVWLEANKTEGRFSENGFIQTNATKTIYFYNETDVSVSELTERLTVTNLKDQSLDT